MRNLHLAFVVLGLLLFGCTTQDPCQQQGYAPVCGTDYQVYDNDCYARYAGVGAIAVTDMSECVEPAACTDSDNGKNLLEMGSARARGGTPYTDYCFSSSSMQEYFCENGEVKVETMACPEGTACANGTCAYPVPSYTCTDSDGGGYSYIKGTTAVGPETRTDACNGTRAVFEYTCSGNHIALSSLNCLGDEICSDGACVSSGTCTDTDGGGVSVTKGTAYKGTERRTDSCYDSNTVLEYYCAGNDIVNIRMDCLADEVCSDGACVREGECSDSDGGFTTIRGTVTSAAGSSTDYCISGSRLKEYMCSDGVETSATIDCDDLGFDGCSDGACIMPCTDTDGGRDIYTVGTASSPTVGSTDTCSNPSTVLEWYCDGNTVRSDSIACPSGYTCSLGRCIVSTPACSDTDGGNIRSVAGSVTTGGRTYSDDCFGTGNQMLKEYYCGASGYAYGDINCSNYGELCWNNACSPAHCTDSDGGQDGHTDGAVRVTTDNGYLGAYYDMCLDNRTVEEWYCSGDEPRIAKVVCAREEICNRATGSCVEAACSDSDGGLDYITAGTITKGIRTENDACIDSSTLGEWYCAGDTVAYEVHTCPAGCDVAQRGCVPL